MSFERLRRKQHHYFNFSKKRLSVWSEGSITTTVFISSSSKAFQALLNKRTQPTFYVFSKMFCTILVDFQLPLTDGLFQMCEEKLYFQFIYKHNIYFLTHHPMGRNYAPLLVYLFLNLYEEKFIQNVVQEKKKNSCFGL